MVTATPTTRPIPKDDALKRRGGVLRVRAGIGFLLALGNRESERIEGVYVNGPTHAGYREFRRFEGG